MNFHTINIAFLFLVVGLGILLAMWVFLTDRKSKINLFFSFFTLSTVFYLVFGFLSHYYGQTDLLVIWKRLFFGSIAIFILSTYFFSVYFPRTGKAYPFINHLILITESIFFVLIIFTDFLVKNVIIRPWGTDVVWGVGKIPWFITMIVFTFIIVGTIVIKYFTLVKKDKIQTSYFLIGIMIFAFFNLIFNMFYPVFANTYRLHYVGDYSTIALLGLTGYAILKYQLFNIKIIAVETTVILLSIGLLVEVALSNNYTEAFLKGIIWLLATYGGWQLIKSVKMEIKQKEDLMKLTKKLEDANDHLHEVDKLKDDFLSMASHELNTPIAAIEGYMSMILDEKLCGDISPKLEQYLTTVYQSSKRLAGLVKDLLNVSRIESGRIHILWDQGKIEDIIDQSIAEVMSKAKEAKHNMVFVKPKKAMPITWFDKTRITEIVINLLGNAIKYTPDGGKITIRAVNDETKIVVSVEDNGKGIPKDKADRVFEKFTQVDVLKDEVKGTGLGMYISKRFIELQGGKIWFKSDGDGKGSTFYFSLPVRNKQPYDPHAGEGLVLH